jgi:hypothetical protein
MLAVMVPWLVVYPIRRKTAAPDQRLPLRWYIMTILGLVSIVALCLNVVGWSINPGPAPLAITTVYVLSYATVAFFRTYSTFLRD